MSEFTFEAKGISRQVICDDTNNPSAVLESGQMVISVFVNLGSDYNYRSYNFDLPIDLDELDKETLSSVPVQREGQVLLEVTAPEEMSRQDRVRRIYEMLCEVEERWNKIYSDPARVLLSDGTYFAYMDRGSSWGLCYFIRKEDTYSLKLSHFSLELLIQCSTKLYELEKALKEAKKVGDTDIGLAIDRIAEYVDDFDEGQGSQNKTKKL